jgi:hypothetical protein
LNVFLHAGIKPHGDLQMRKNGWKKMQQATYLNEAAQWSKELTRMRARGPGDTKNAMRAIARDYDLEYGTLWRLRYRLSELKDIGVTAYMKLQIAYRSECERQLRKLQNDIIRTEKITGPDGPAIRSSKTILGQDVE